MPRIWLEGIIIIIETADQKLFTKVDCKDFHLQDNHLDGPLSFMAYQRNGLKMESGDAEQISFFT